jgi:hypothetical protein
MEIEKELSKVGLFLLFFSFFRDLRYLFLRSAVEKRRRHEAAVGRELLFFAKE